MKMRSDEEEEEKNAPENAKRCVLRVDKVRGGAVEEKSSRCNLF